MRLALAVLGTTYVTTLLLALWATPTISEAVPPVFEDPQNPLNPLYYLVLVLAITGLLLLVIKWGQRWIIRWVVLSSVFLTSWYLLGPLLAGPLGPTAAEIVALSVSAAVVALLLAYPEWWVIDLAGVIVGAGAATLFGISFGILPAILLLVGLAAYDAWAVYRTRHMVRLAEAVLDLRLPILLVAPLRWDYSFRKAAPGLPKGENREAFFLGLGDIVVPGVLVVSARRFLSALEPINDAPFGLDPSLAVSLGTLAGALVGLAILLALVARGRPHAGLPLLNALALLGFLVVALPLYGTAALTA